MMYPEEITKKMGPGRALKQIPVTCGSKPIEGSTKSESMSRQPKATLVKRSVDARREKIALGKLKLQHLKILITWGTNKLKLN